MFHAFAAGRTGADAHAINNRLASLDQRIRHGSIKVIREELERGSVLGARYIMTHLGSHTGQTLEDGIAKVADAVIQALDGYQGTTQLLLEIAAGTGNIIGDTFDEIGDILGRLGLPLDGFARLNFQTGAKGAKAEGMSKNLGGFAGICFDTCHAFASGYDFRTAEGAGSVLEEFGKKIGLEYLRLAHINDSKVDLGGKRDRHEHIGDGFIGREGMANILSTTEFRNIDWLLETEDSKREVDIVELKKIRS
ncbi:MAG: TIM barrel protein [Candidatus Yanofskybacteria bacterium]|nr:TIM barrel protein [Candidatus Yanofskybacteria bacterium]